MEAALFDGADCCNDVCCGNKLIAWTMETLVIGGGGSIGPWIWILSLLPDYVIVNKIMMQLLWKRHYSMAPIVVMVSAATINYLQWRRTRSHRRRRSRVIAS